MAARLGRAGRGRGHGTGGVAPAAAAAAGPVSPRAGGGRRFTQVAAPGSLRTASGWGSAFGPARRATQHLRVGGTEFYRLEPPVRWGAGRPGGELRRLLPRVPVPPGADIHPGGGRPASTPRRPPCTAEAQFQAPLLPGASLHFNLLLM